MNNILNFITQNLIDFNYGIPAVLSNTKKDVVTDNYLLSDISLAIISFYLTKNNNEALKLYHKKFSYYIDNESTGYHEQLDISGSFNNISFVRTPKKQALALLAEYICQVKILKNNNHNKFEKNIELLINHTKENNWPNVFDRDYKLIIDDRQHLDTVSILTIVYIFITTKYFLDTKSATYNKKINELQERLDLFTTNKGVIGALTGANNHDLAYGYHLHDSSIASLAWIYLFNAGIKIGRSKAFNILSHINNNHRHESGYGLWDRISYNNKVEVDPISYFYGKIDSPFPTINLRDHAILAICTKEYLKISSNSLVESLQEDALSEIYRYTDYRLGGVFHGQGYWFSTPFDATVPLARHVMVKNHTKGSFNVGNTSYIPFNEKHSDTQFLTLIALYRSIQKPNCKINNGNTKLKSNNIKNNLTPASFEKLSKNIINLNKYISWLKSTASGYGFGLTPYRSPLGLRSDKTPQIFSALHVISDFKVLNLEVDNENELVSNIVSVQNLDGGFSEQPGLLSEIFTTYCAVLTCVILNKIYFDVESCIKFTLSCQHIEGGFGNTPGYPCDIWHTNLAVLTLVALDQKPLRENDLISYIIKCQNNDGGYGNQPGTKSDTFATFRAVSSLLALGYIPPCHKRTINWLQNLQTSTGGFLYKNNSAESFVGSYHAIAALYILNSYPTNKISCIKYISERQNTDGGFARGKKYPSETTDEGFIAIQALHMLEGKLNPYWATIIT